MEAPDYCSKPMGYSAKQKQLQSSSGIFFKAAVAAAFLVAMVSLAIAVLSHVNVKGLETKVEKCVPVTILDGNTRRERGLQDNQELKVLSGEIAEIQAKVKELAYNASIAYSDLKSIVDDLREEVYAVHKAKGKDYI